MSLHVTVLNALTGDLFCEIDADQSWAVADVKKTICENFAISLYGQKLLQNGATVKDDTPLWKLARLVPNDFDSLSLEIMRIDVARAAVFEQLAYGNTLGDIEAAYREDAEIVSFAVQQYALSAEGDRARCFPYASCELQGNRDFVLTLIMDLSILSASAAASGVWPYLSEDLRADPEIVRATLGSGMPGMAERCWNDVIESLPCTVLQDRSLVLEIARSEDTILSRLPCQLRQDLDFVFELVRSNSYILRYAPLGLWQSQEFLQRAVDNDLFALDYVPITLWLDRPFVLMAVRLDGAALGRAVQFQNDLEVAVAAVENCRDALRFV
jgi:hypothetical protein